MNHPPRHILSAAVVVTNDDGEILLIKTPLRGWELPGGQVEEGESALIAAVREAKEEAGAEVEITQFCGIFQSLEKRICNLLFTGIQVGGVLSTSPESLEVGYFPVERALEMVTYSNFGDRIRMCLDRETHPFCIVY